MKKFAVSLTFIFLTVCLSFGCLVSASAQENDTDEFMLEEITVTAEKREANLQKTAISMTAVTGTDAVTKGMVSMDDLMKDIPNVMMSPIGFGSTVTIRGLGMDLPVGVGESAVSTNFDGSFDNGSQSTIFGYFDMDRVEVLRGPQGTLYGRNATGGVINMVSKNPNTEAIEGYAVYELGDYSLQREEGAINLPVTDSVATRFAFTNIDRKGYMSTGSGDKVGTALRGKLSYQPTEDTSLVFSVSSNRLGGISPNTQITTENYNAGNYFLSTETSPLQKYDNSSVKYSATIDFPAGPGMVTFLPSYSENKDRGWTYSPWEQELQEVAPRDNKQLSGELRYSAKADARIFWQAGLYYYDREQTDAPSDRNPSGSDQGALSRSVYGQVTYPFADDLRLTVGARYSDEKTDMNKPDQGPDLTDVSSTFGGFDWKLGLEYDLAEDIMTYLTLATSRRPGGFNDFPGVAGTTFDEETLMSYELGVKSRFMDNRLQLNGSAFYYDYDKYQAVDAWMDFETQEFRVLFFNVPKVMNYGAELEVEALFGTSTVLSGSVSYLHARYDSTFILHSDPFTPGIDLNGYPLPRSPDWSIKGSLEHTFALPGGGALRPSVNVRWIDDHYVAPFPGEAQLAKAYTVVDAYLRFVAPNNTWSLNGWVKNANEEVYKTSGSADNCTLGEPRMVGVTLTIQF